MYLLEIQNLEVGSLNIRTLLNTYWIKKEKHLKIIGLFMCTILIRDSKDRPAAHKFPRQFLAL